MPDKPHHGGSRFCHAYQNAIPKNTRQIITSVVLMPAHLPDEKVSPYNAACRALWDTGAQGSTISETLAAALKLPVVGQTRMIGAGGPYTANVHLAGLILPNAVKIPHIRLAGFKGSKKFDMLIGMDIISMGDFLLSTEGETTHFSFHAPSWGGFYLSGIKGVVLHNGLHCEQTWNSGLQPQGTVSLANMKKDKE